MIKTRDLIAFLAIAAALAAPRPALAQFSGEGMGSALSNNAMSHQAEVMPGISDTASRAQTETPFKIIKDVKLGLKDADPLARVGELKKLRYLKGPEADGILIRSMTDPDMRVKIKAIDILGARGANAAVQPMSSLLFLRTTEPIVKLHLVAALGRIGDANGALAVMQYLEEPHNAQERGTAVFALGEIASGKAAPLLDRVIAQDRSEMVQRLAREALEKINGDLPTERYRKVASAKGNMPVPTDQKLAKLRAMDQKLQASER
ncbi:MAG: HEAT repeat domain-containing protein [Candidatus Binataceae bacterium]